ncbi:ABC transporter ATP-binding protein [Anaeromicropila herbilytica]|uniref:Multidrug ABC transporter ATPase n=1 Tax=Anaeromicropila herbilytica TaxID=2785025 RepID=A0A7R7EIR1_9FIRM|nr:ABC transporter ATP-binding protein [Anaeromicropila herbilytica]BCN29490.1 multidrug ABC transporter ATPase [Anaeromicropila herbilytica]
MQNILEIRNLSKRYGEKSVVEDLSFQLKEGEILGFLGPNGAGKSTTISLITAIQEKDAGKILLYGKETERNMQEFKRSLGVVPQEIALYEDLSAYDNVDFFCSLYGYKKKIRKERVQKALEQVGLWEHRNETPNKFSGGMKRRLNIACSIAHTPKILIMDEPTVGIDPQSRNHILETIRVLNESGTTVIYVSHYMEEIESLCGRIILMDHGTLMEDIGKDALKDKYQPLGLNNLEEIFLYLTGTELRDKEEA